MALRSMARTVAETVLGALPRATAPGDRLILSYHNVVPSGSPPRGDRSLHLPLDQFERQLQTIRAEADVVPLMELLTSEEPRARRVAITFDDAYGSAMKLAVPACVSHGFSCTVFVAPALLGLVPTWDVRAERGAWSDQSRDRYLRLERGRGEGHPAHSEHLRLLAIATTETLSRVRDLPGVSFGNHSMSHANLGALTTEEASADLTQARDWLATFAPNNRIPVVAYPYGIPPTVPSEALRAADVEFGLLVTGGWARGEFDPLHFPRLNVPGAISVNGFRLRLRGRMA